MTVEALSAAPAPPHRLDRVAALAALWAFVLCVGMHLPLLGSYPLAGTEGHRALTAHGMVRSGDWLVPRLFDRLYLRKPPLHYWAIAASESIAGEGDEWVWRLPTPIFAGLTAAALALFGHRWFGRAGGVAAGLSMPLLVALWTQSRTADIDALNTLASTLLTLCLIELHVARPGAAAGWTALTALAFAATLLTKGPAGLAAPAGAVAWPLWLGYRRGDWGWAKPPWGLLGVALGAALAGVWALAVYRALTSGGQPLDLSGLREGASNLVADGPGRFLKALAVPPLLLAYALPVSIGLFVVVQPRFRALLEPRARALADAVVAAVLLAWAGQLLTGMVNERYGYPTLPLLCMLVGATAAIVPACTPKQARELAIVASIVAVSLAVGAVVLAALARADASARAPSAVAAGACALAAALGVGRLRRGELARGALLLVVQAALLSVPFGYVNRAQRESRSGFQASAVLRQTVGEGAAVTVGAMLRFQPELFHYAGVRVRAYGEDIPAPSDLHTTGWLVLNDQEHALYREQAGARLSREVEFTSNRRRGWIVWHEAPYY